MELQKGLPIVEGVSLIGGNVVQGQPKRVGIYKLNISGKPPGWPDLQSAPDPRQNVYRVVA
jgi:hypothetical protein